MPCPAHPTLPGLYPSPTVATNPWYTRGSAPHLNPGVPNLAPEWPDNRGMPPGERAQESRFLGPYTRGQEKARLLFISGAKLLQN